MLLSSVNITTGEKEGLVMSSRAGELENKERQFDGSCFYEITYNWI